MSTGDVTTAEARMLAARVERNVSKESPTIGNDELMIEAIRSLADQLDDWKDNVASVMGEECGASEDDRVHCTCVPVLREEVRRLRSISESSYIDIVFDGPPSHESGRFVEVEHERGASIRIGEWIKRPDGYWVLRITRAELGGE